MRVNYLNEELKNALDNRKITLTTAEQLSFLKPKIQKMIASLIINENRKITEEQAKLLKEMHRNEYMTEEKANKILNKENKNEKISIVFSKIELKEFFGEIDSKKEIKKLLIDMLRNNSKIH